MLNLLHPGLAKVLGSIQLTSDFNEYDLRELKALIEQYGAMQYDRGAEDALTKEDFCE